MGRTIFSKGSSSTGTITITVGDAEKTFSVSDDVKFTRGDKELKKKLQSKVFDKNPAVTLVTEGEGDNEVLKEVRLTAAKKDKDKP